MALAFFFAFLSLVALLFDGVAVHTALGNTTVLLIWLVVLVALSFRKKETTVVALAAGLAADAMAGSFIGVFTIAVGTGIIAREFIHRVIVSDALFGKLIAILGTFCAASLGFMLFSLLFHFSFNFLSVMRLGEFALLHIVGAVVVTFLFSPLQRFSIRTVIRL